MTSSRAQLELSSALRAAGWEHELEVPLEGGLLVVDLACARARVVVEFDGATHYVVDASTGEESYDGSTRWKTRVLEVLGWRVFRVGWREWSGHPIAAGTRQSREELVAALVASILRQ